MASNCWYSATALLGNPERSRVCTPSSRIRKGSLTSNHAGNSCVTSYAFGCSKDGIEAMPNIGPHSIGLHSAARMWRMKAGNRKLLGRLGEVLGMNKKRKLRWNWLWFFPVCVAVLVVVEKH